MTARDPLEPLRAGFNPLIKPYLVLYAGLSLAITVVLIPLAALWFCGLGPGWARHYFNKLECELGPAVRRNPARFTSDTGPAG